MGIYARNTFALFESCAGLCPCRGLSSDGHESSRVEFGVVQRTDSVVKRVISRDFCSAPLGALKIQVEVWTLDRSRNR